MKNEAEFKTIFKKSVRKIGGYCESLAAPTFPGIPDLYCIVPGYMPVLLEAKFFKDVGDIFTRKIPYTAMQQRWLDKTNEVHPLCSFGLIGIKYDKEYYCLLTENYITHVNDKLLKKRGFIIKNKAIDVRTMFSIRVPSIQVPKVHIQPYTKLID